MNLILLGYLSTNTLVWSIFLFSWVREIRHEKEKGIEGWGLTGLFAGLMGMSGWLSVDLIIKLH